MKQDEIEKSGDFMKQEDSLNQGNTASGSIDKINAIRDEAERTFISKPAIRINDLIQKEYSKGKTSRKSRTVIDPFGVADLVIEPLEVLPNETVTISFKATNNSDVYSMYSINLKINSEVVAAEVMKLPPGISIPLYFTVKRNLPGEYLVKVNHLVGKFNVAGSSIEHPREEDNYNSSDKFELGLSEIDAYLRQKRSNSERAGRPASGLQYGIDKTADLIEQGLDKVGEGLIFPIVKLVDGFNKLFNFISSKSRK